MSTNTIKNAGTSNGVDIFNALAVPNRRKILEMLANQGQLPATAIAHKFSVSPPAISQHLKILKEAGLLVMKKNKQQRIYQINPKKMHEIEHWAKKLAEQWSQRFDRLDDILKEEKATILKNYTNQLNKSAKS